MARPAAVRCVVFLANSRALFPCLAAKRRLAAPPDPRYHTLARVMHSTAEASLQEFGYNCRALVLRVQCWTIGSMNTFLHVGCGPKRKNQTTQGFNTPEWNELRFDIDPSVQPDVQGTMTDMAAVSSGSVNALFSSHNIEHLYPHEVPVALQEFARVLSADGFVVITCPDLQGVCELVAQDKLTEAAYTSPAGPIAPIDILYGHRPAMAQGNLFMAHRCGFTQKVLVATLQAAGFATVASMRRAGPFFDLWAIASKTARDEAALRDLAVAHFPGSHFPGAR